MKNKLPKKVEAQQNERFLLADVWSTQNQLIDYLAELTEVIQELKSKQ